MTDPDLKTKAAARMARKRERDKLGLTTVLVTVPLHNKDKIEKLAAEMVADHKKALAK